LIFFSFFTSIFPFYLVDSGRSSTELHHAHRHTKFTETVLHQHLCKESGCVLALENFGSGRFVSYILFRHLWRFRKEQSYVFSDVTMGGFIVRILSV
jgi:hypothetical protein